jgi:hypothetical protein
MAVLFGFTRMENDGIAAIRTLAPLVGGAVLLSAFVLCERCARAPLVRFEILRVRSLRAASLAVGANALAFMAVVYIGTLYLRTALGYGAFRAGLGLLPIDVVALVVSLAASASVARRSPRAVLCSAFLAIVVALLWLARAPVPADYLVDVMAPLVVLGVAVPAVFIVSTHEAVADVGADEKGLASGVFETANHLLGGAIGVAVYATVLAAASGSAPGGTEYRAAFLTAAALVIVLGAAATGQARRRTTSTPRPASCRPLSRKPTAPPP